MAHMNKIWPRLPKKRQLFARAAFRNIQLAKNANAALFHLAEFVKFTVPDYPRVAVSLLNKHRPNYEADLTRPLSKVPSKRLTGDNSKRRASPGVKTERLA
jgi:hypothetical protein